MSERRPDEAEEVAAASSPAASEATSEKKEGEEAFPWYVVRVQVAQEDKVRKALLKRIRVRGLEDRFGKIVVPTEDVIEFTKTGRRRVVKRKLFPGYLMMQIDVSDDDAWFLVRETPGVGDFLGGRAGERPTPMDPAEVKRILEPEEDAEGGEKEVKMAIPFRVGDQVRVKEGHFENYEGEVESIDESNGTVTVIITIFGRSVPVELKHWHLEVV